MINRNRSMNMTIGRNGRIGLAMVIAACVAVPAAFAADVPWDAGGADNHWLTQENWVGDKVPAAADTAKVNMAATAEIRIGDNITVANLLVSHDGDVHMIGGDVTLTGASGLTISDSNGTGTMTVDAGMLTTTGNQDKLGIVVGNIGNGTLTVNGGELVGDHEIVVGTNGGTGTLVINGGDVKSVDDIRIGDSETPSTGIIEMHGGFFHGGWTIVGIGDTNHSEAVGIWNQDGGTFQNDFGDFEIGKKGEGTVTLSGTAVMQATETGNPLLLVGHQGVGTMTITGAAHLDYGRSPGNGEIVIGNQAQADGSLTISGNAAVDVNGQVVVGAAGINGELYVRENPTLNFAEEFIIAQAAPGTLGIEGGDASITVGSFDMDPQGTQDALLIASIDSTGLSTIDVAGIAHLTDTLEVRLANGFQPKGGETYAVVTALGGLDGTTFGTEILPDLATGLSWNVNYSANAITLKVLGTLVLGDVNGDGVVNGLDVDPFVEVLLSGPYDAAADMNQDEVVNGLDVDPFVVAVVGGGGAQAVPEPSGLLLALLGVLGLVAAGWRRCQG
jgi:hypothetical protein